MLYNIKPTMDKFKAAYGLKAGVILVLMDRNLATHYRLHCPDGEPGVISPNSEKAICVARQEALKANEIHEYRYVVMNGHLPTNEAYRLEAQVDASVFFGIGENRTLYMRVNKARGLLDGVPGFPSRQDIYLIPVLNKHGADRAPVGSELEEGMVLYSQNGFQYPPLLPLPEHYCFSCLAFNKEKSVTLMEVDDKSIDWVNETPILDRPVIISQAYQWYPQELDGSNGLPGQPFTFSLRNTFGYNNNLWSWRTHGDVTTVPRHLTHRDVREKYLADVRNNNADIVFPAEYYYDAEAKKLVPLYQSIV